MDISNKIIILWCLDVRQVYSLMADHMFCTHKFWLNAPSLQSILKISTGRPESSIQFPKDARKAILKR